MERNELRDEIFHEYSRCINIQGMCFFLHIYTMSCMYFGTKSGLLRNDFPIQISLEKPLFRQEKNTATTPSRCDYNVNIF